MLTGGTGHHFLILVDIDITILNGPEKLIAKLAVLAAENILALVDKVLGSRKTLVGNRWQFVGHT